jgi:HPt (histidine-containing phosphotransfer) domain-containing protein
LSEPLLNLGLLAELERWLGRERIIRVVTAQIVNGRELTQRLSALEEAPEPERVKALAHQIAGSSGAIGLQRLSGQAGALERAADATAPAELALEIRSLLDCLDSSQAALRERFPELTEL